MALRLGQNNEPGRIQLFELEKGCQKKCGRDNPER